MVLGLLWSSNAYAGNFSVECKRGDLKYETWGHRNNDIWFIKEDEKDVCKIYRDKNLVFVLIILLKNLRETKLYFIGGVINQINMFWIEHLQS